MAEIGDIVARLNRMITRDATGYTIALDPDVIPLAATTLTDQAAQIERLTELDAQRTVQAIELMDRATTAERERDEARAEVERKDAALREARKAALEEAAAVFDVYASDQRASIAEGGVTGIGVNNAEVRAETWEEAAWQLRNAAAEAAPPKSKEEP